MAREEILEAFRSAAGPALGAGSKPAFSADALDSVELEVDESDPAKVTTARWTFEPVAGGTCVTVSGSNQMRELAALALEAGFGDLNAWVAVQGRIGLARKMAECGVIDDEVIA